MSRGLEAWREEQRVPSLGEGFQELGPDSNLTFSSHAWTISLDPSTGALLLAHHLNSERLAQVSGAQVSGAQVYEDLRPLWVAARAHALLWMPPRYQVLLAARCCEESWCLASHASTLKNQQLLVHKLDSAAAGRRMQRSRRVMLHCAGALAGLQRRYGDRTGAQWAGSERPLGLFCYSAYTEEDYNVVWDEYLYISRDNWWVGMDFGKANCSEAGPRRADEAAALQQAWAKQVRAHQTTQSQGTRACGTAAMRLLPSRQAVALLLAARPAAAGLVMAGKCLTGLKHVCRASAFLYIPHDPRMCPM